MSFISSGMVTNNGDRLFDINPYLNRRIEGIVIHCIPVGDPTVSINLKTLLTPLTIVLPISPTLSHIIIQILFDNYDFMFMEYGQYITRESSERLQGINNLNSSSSQPRRENNDNLYYYVNRDGVRITKLNIDIANLVRNKAVTPEIEEEVRNRIISQYYNLSPNMFMSYYRRNPEYFRCVICEAKNKITLRELCMHFQNEKWEAKNYDVLTHNCQDFGAEVIKIVKAIRLREIDKVRLIEKFSLPHCIIQALWDNESLSISNTIGRIPIIGSGFDLLRCITWPLTH